MAILDELLDSIKKLDVDEQLRITCDQIFKEEVLNPMEYEGPEGPNIFLSLPVENMLNKLNNNKYKTYICLEREAAGAFIISHWNCLANVITSTPKRVKAWEVKQVKTKKILKEFAEKLQFLKGE